MKNVCTFIIALLCTIGLAAQELTVGSYNIRYKNKEDSINSNGWHQRCKHICDQIIWENPDIFGAQEVLHPQLMDLEKGLPAYRWIGVGRDDGKQEGEYAAIFYNPERVELLEKGNFWLSETPEKPSIGWDAALNRICSWGRFRDLQTKQEFIFLNLHMDHVGVKARSESAKLVMKRITEMTDGGKKLAVLTGDFNVPQTNELYTLFTSSGVLKDCYTNAATRFAVTGTYNSFKTQTWTHERIDHIFVTPSTKVNAYATLTDSYWSKDENGKMVRRNLSDHYPIFARISF